MSYYSFCVLLQSDLLESKIGFMNIYSFCMIIGISNRDWVFRNVKSRDSF